MLNDTAGLRINTEGRISRADAERRKIELSIENGRRKIQRERKAALSLDVQRAENLRRSRAIANVKPGTGPRIAK